jgi:hypothetical protein
MVALLSGLAAVAHAQAQSSVPPSRAVVEFTSLKIMREKGIITQDEFDSAMRDLGETVGTQAGESLTLMLGRWSTTMYGFVEADQIWDSTQSFNDVAGNAQVKRPGTYVGDNGRMMFGVRNSRLGFRMRAPEFHKIRASAMLEMDFLGNQGPIGYTNAFNISEGAYFTNPSFRVRHANLRLETPIVDVLIGQFWQLFGWQSLYHPNTVQIQGVPGQIYSRTPQIRVSKTVRTEPITFEAAVAIMRPPQRDSGAPEGQFGARLAYNKWTGMQTVGAAGSAISPLSVAVTADVRPFSLPEFAQTPTKSVDKTGWGIAADAFIPLIPARPQKRGNALSLNAEYAWGYGTADLYTGLSGGVSNATLPPDAKGNPQTFTPNADPSLVVFAADGTAHLIQWQSYLFGLQYYFPKLDGRLWISGNYSHLDSNNTKFHGAAAAVRDSEDWFDINLFGDLTPAVRLGLEYAWYDDHYVDGKDAINHRVQLSAFYLF